MVLSPTLTGRQMLSRGSSEIESELLFCIRLVAKNAFQKWWVRRIGQCKARARGTYCHLMFGPISTRNQRKMTSMTSSASRGPLAGEKSAALLRRFAAFLRTQPRMPCKLTQLATMQLIQQFAALSRVQPQFIISTVLSGLAPFAGSKASRTIPNNLPATDANPDSPGQLRR